MCFAPIKLSQTLKRQLPAWLHLEIYTDGSCLNNGKNDAQCGSGIWIPGTSQLNQAGEVAAILIGLQITFITDSRYVIDGLTNHLSSWEDKGWIGIENSKLFKATVYHLRMRSATTAFRWIKGHSGNQGNDEADKLAGTGAKKDLCDQIDTNIPRNFDIQGAKLTRITQATAYQGIMSSQKLNHKHSTLGLLEITRHTIKEVLRSQETDQTIWHSRRHKDLSKKFQNFFWTNIPNFEQRAHCPHCRDDTESIEHILVECDHPTTKLIWRLAKRLWPHNDNPWPNTSIGTILGCGALQIPKEHDENDGTEQQPKKCNRGASRLMRILISESAYLIWVLRCERVIQSTSHNKRHVTKRWSKAIEHRLQLDRVSAAKLKRTPVFTSLIISRENPLPHNWATSLEVLVGIKFPRPPQTEVT
ncbi:ribonuclease H-like protein [Suillus ampliporus]|nr:ribonuclease H-like protein [Suillus ampliporus]